MFGLLVLLTSCLALAAPAVATSAADRGWIARGGFGGIVGSRDFDPGAVGGFAGLAFTVQPWFEVGAEAGLYRLGRERYVAFLTGSDYLHADPSSFFKLAATARLQVPVRSGPAPFLAMEGGVGLLRHGDVGGYDGFPPATYSYTGETEFASGAAVVIGVRTVLPRAWPDVEVSVSAGLWSTQDPMMLVEPRLALAF